MIGRRLAGPGVPLALALAVACGGDKGGDGTGGSPTTDLTTADSDPITTVDSAPTADTATSTLVLAAADAGPDLVVETGEVVTLGGASVGVSLLWDMGDGTQSTDAEPEHSWAEPGTYTLVVQATGSDGGTDTDTAKVVVHPPFADAAPTASSTVVIDEQGLIYAVEPDAGTVVRTDGVGVERVAPCSGPRTLSVAGEVVAVACEGDGSVVLLDRDDLTVTDRIGLGMGARPFGITGRDGRRWWVTDPGRDELLEVLDGLVVATHAVDDPRHLLAILQPTEPSVPTRVVMPRWRSIDGEGHLQRLDESTHALAFDPGPDSDTSIRGVPTLFGAMATSPDAAVALVPGLLANTARGMWRDGQVLSFETTVHAVLIAVDLATGDELFRKQLDNQGEASAVATSPYGDTAYVAFPGTQTVQALDAWDGDIVGSVLDAGHDITGLAVTADGGTLVVHASLDRELRAYDVTSFSPAPALLWTMSTVDLEPLAPEVLLGKRLFHDAADPRMAKDGYIRCAVCHPDGGEDGLVWDFTDRGEGLRNTIDLRGRAGTAMGPLHWSANFDEVQDFEHDLRGPFQGLGLLTDADWTLTNDPLGTPKAGLSADLDALAAYVTSLATPLPPIEAELVTGRLAFEDAGCDACHPAPLYTDSPTGVRHDVGTLLPSSGQRLGGVLDGIDTPTLLGVGHSGPWLHDGSAATLDEALAAHADGISTAALVQFLQSL